MQTLKRLSDHIVYFTPVGDTDRPVLAAISGSKRTLIMDAGNSVSHAALFERELAKEGIHGDFVVLTHSHWDHVFGLEHIAVPVLAHQDTYRNIQEMLPLSWDDASLDGRVAEGTEIAFCADAIKLEHREHRNIRLKLPDITFETSLTVDLGGITCLIDHVGGDHAGDSTVIYVPEEKTLLLGDSLYANLYAKDWEYTSRNIRELIGKLESYAADTYILSHQEAPLGKEEMMEEFVLLKECARLVEKYYGDREQIEAELAVRLNRKVTEDDRETVGYFVNGYRRGQIP